MAFMNFIFAALLASASARSIVLETVPVLPAGWKQSDVAVDSNNEMTFSIALKHSNAEPMSSVLASKSDHLSRDDVRSLRAPDQAHVDSVMEWLASEDIEGKADHDMIKIQTTVDKAAKLLGADFHYFNYDDKVAKLRTLEYSVPEDVAEAISFVHPVANFMRPTRESEVKPEEMAAAQSNAADAESDGAVCANGVTPSCLKKLYNINYSAPDNNSDVRFAISGYLEQNGNHKDLQSFFKQYYPELSGYDFDVELVNGGKDPQSPAGGEAMLDLEYGMAIGYPAAVTYYATGGRGTKLDDDGKPLQGKEDDNEPYMEFIQHLLDKPDNEVPHVLSVSYGDDELTVPKAYAKRVCDLYGMLTKRGTTVIHSSGDGGAAGGRVGNCRSKDGKNTKTTMPTFPAGCPWVTAVGGTTNTKEPAPGVDFSSGGFSTYFTRESWQVDATDGYVEALNGHLDGYYNATGRGIPDVSLAATSYKIILNGRRSNIGGTSASAPVFAGMIALVNDARLRAGKKSIGHLNPILYSDEVKAVLQDTDSGVSAGCDFADGGWPATKGWDAITGLGVPKNFDKFMEILVAA